MTDDPTPERDDAGKFPQGVSGNPVGRPKGSKNKVTLMKLMAEEAVRTKNEDRMLEVADLVIERALEGDFRCSKLVWEAIMSRSSADDASKAREKVEIKLNLGSSRPEKEVLDAEAMPIADEAAQDVEYTSVDEESQDEPKESD